MRAALSVFILLSLTLATQAQPKPAPPDDPAQALQQWLEDNLDLDVIQTLQDRFAGTNMLELGSLQAAAAQALPVLQDYEETQPLALWLQAHMDELEAADEMLREMQTLRPQPGNTNAPVVPPLQLQRRVWVGILAKRPWPPLAQNYVPRLKRIFLAEQVPPELVWVAEVESAFDSRARSPSGAAGMFQLKPATARAEKLSLWPFDQRLQADKSARAAARYLRQLHRHFGDWRLALAAYNAGQGRVDRLLKRTKARSFDAIASRLPAETQLYVPRVEATIGKRENVTFEDLKLR